MKRIRRCAARTLTAAMLCVGVFIFIAAGSRGPAVRVAAAAQGLSAAPQYRPGGRADRGHPHRENVVLLWNAALLDAVRAIRFAPMFPARAPDRTLMAVEITGTGATFNHSVPRALFPTRVKWLENQATGRHDAPSRDSRRFLIAKATDPAGSTPIMVMLNWAAGLAR
jgi:hypothetical protein